VRVTILVLDVDGVVVLGHPDGGRWDRNLLSDLGIAPADVQAKFFRRHWQAIAAGKANLLQVLRGMWHELECTTAPDAFIEYWFANDSRLNHELFDIVDAWRARGNAAFLATVQEHQRAQYLWEKLELRDHFDGMHYSADLGAAKPDARFYERTHARLPVSSRDDVVFLDDAIENVEAAADFGWRARHYTGVDDLRAALREAK
jgi:putative hydrolase of the HAD superfamily